MRIHRGAARGRVVAPGPWALGVALVEAAAGVAVVDGDLVEVRGEPRVQLRRPRDAVGVAAAEPYVLRLAEDGLPARDHPGIAAGPALGGDAAAERERLGERVDHVRAARRGGGEAVDRDRHR